MTDAEPAAEQRERVLAGLTAYSSGQSALGREFARRMSMHPTDSAAIVEILRAEDRGRPITPARLAGRIGLTSGATSILLNRLEDAGHITRLRGHDDRRMVTLHSAQAVHASADDFFEPLRAQLDDVMSHYPSEQLALFESLVNQLLQTVEEYSRQEGD